MSRLAVLALSAALCGAASPLAMQAAVAAPAKASAYTAPRNAFGQPDLSGNWSNVSMTYETRPASAKGPVYSPEEARAIEQADVKAAIEANKPIDPNASGPSKGGDKKVGLDRPEFAAAGGAVGGYDRGWLDAGAQIMRVNGEPRTSILTTPDGKVPKTRTGQAEPPFRGGGRDGLGSFDNVENRSLGERCIIGFGRNAGPPMLANGFYNNDYQIVQGPNEVKIVIEMVHDVRTIRLNSQHRTDGIRPWMGDSIGHYEGDTLVVETTNIPRAMAYHGSWKDLTVTERFTRVGPDRVLYQFKIHDPTMWDQDWGGEYEFHPLKGQLYEYACAEGNYALEHMLAGAREEEKREKTGKGS